MDESENPYRAPEPNKDPKEHGPFPFGLRTMFVVVALIAVPFAFGPPRIQVGEVNGHGVYEPNLMFWPLAIIEAIGAIAWLWRRNKRHDSSKSA